MKCWIMISAHLYSVLEYNYGRSYMNRTCNNLGIKKVVKLISTIWEQHFVMGIYRYPCNATHGLIEVLWWVTLRFPCF